MTTTHLGLRRDTLTDSDFAPIIQQPPIHPTPLTANLFFPKEHIYIRAVGADRGRGDNGGCVSLGHRRRLCGDAAWRLSLGFPACRMYGPITPRAPENVYERCMSGPSGRAPLCWVHRLPIPEPRTSALLRRHSRSSRTQRPFFPRGTKPARVTGRAA